MTKREPHLPQTNERLRRWRLILGGGDADGTGVELEEADLRADTALDALYDPLQNSQLAASAPYAARWLGDIRACFPAPVVQIIQKDALRKLNLGQMLLEPEFIENIEPDVNLVAALLALNSTLPAPSRESARVLVQKVVDELEQRLGSVMRQAVMGALNRAERTRRPRRHAIDWRQTIQRNLKHYQPAYKTIIPERLVGYAHRLSHSLPQRTVILCVDQSASMASSVVYAGLFGAVLASLKAIKTHVVVFDTSVVDLTDQLDDPVTVLFGTQLGGGTDIRRALAYCQRLIRQPNDTILVLISDLRDNISNAAMLKTADDILAAGTQMICLLALNDEGKPNYHTGNAAAFAARGITTFACTPDRFADLMAAAIQRLDLDDWYNSTM